MEKIIKPHKNKKSCSITELKDSDIINLLKYSAKEVEK